MNPLWRPPCPCGAQCLTPHAPRVALVTIWARFLASAAVLTVAALAMRLQTTTLRRQRTAPAVARWAARTLLRCMGIRWSVVGAAIRPGALLVGNHVSWLDIVVMMAIGDDRLRIVAKAEVGSWPVIGRLARACGAVFVDRARPRSLPATVAQVAAALRHGNAVQVFPEGTTTCGAHPARWRSAFLQAAIDAGAPVQRFTLLFSTPKAAFVDDDSLLASVRRVLALRGLSITVLVDQAQRTGAADRKELAARLTPKTRLEQRVNHGGRA